MNLLHSEVVLCSLCAHRLKHKLTLRERLKKPEMTWNMNLLHFEVLLYSVLTG